MWILKVKNVLGEMVEIDRDHRAFRNSERARMVRDAYRKYIGFGFSDVTLYMWVEGAGNWVPDNIPSPVK